jgi:hypothetical protein
MLNPVVPIPLIPTAGQFYYMQPYSFSISIILDSLRKNVNMIPTNISAIVISMGKVILNGVKLVLNNEGKKINDYNDLIWGK